MSDYESLLNAASQLPTSEKVQFIEALWESVPSTSPPPLSEDWLTEIKRRSDEFVAGGVETVSWETVRDEALRRVGIDVAN